VTAATTTPTAGGTSADPADGPTRNRRSRGRIALWSGLAALVVFAVFIAMLATIGPSKANSALLGKPAPSVSGKELATGRPVSLDDYAGKWVLVNFAASWCIPCQDEMPALRQFARAGTRYDATILTVTYDPSDTASLRSMLHDDDATWPAVADAAADVSWGVHDGIPQSFLVSPEGLVVAYFPSGVQATLVESTIRQASGSAASGSAAPGTAASAGS
jgi:peroxiredoxin